MNEREGTLLRDEGNAGTVEVPEKETRTFRASTPSTPSTPNRAFDVKCLFLRLLTVEGQINPLTPPFFYCRLSVQ